MNSGTPIDWPIGSSSPNIRWTYVVAYLKDLFLSLTTSFYSSQSDRFPLLLLLQDTRTTIGRDRLNAFNVASGVQLAG